MTICKKTYSAVRRKSRFVSSPKENTAWQLSAAFKFRVLPENMLYLSIQVMLGFEAMN